MQENLEALALTAAALGVIHTAMGPDHYIPFIALSKDGNWPLRRTLLVTFGCGVAHVSSSVLLGLLGVMVGSTLQSLTHIERLRGDAAGWLLLGLGLAYTAWGLRLALRREEHSHWHAHGDGTFHSHNLPEQPRHGHPDPAGGNPRSAPRNAYWTWVIFLIFAFGPCEPLIPLLIYPAATLSYQTAFLVSCVFGAATLATMMTIVVAGYYGLAHISSNIWHRYSHAFCGLAIAACGGLVCFGF